MDKKMTIGIPEPLYIKIKQILDGTEFESVEEFVIHVLNDLITTKASLKKERIINEGFSEEEIEKIKARLRNLGYL